MTVVTATVPYPQSLNTDCTKCDSDTTKYLIRDPKRGTLLDFCKCDSTYYNSNTTVLVGPGENLACEKCNSLCHQCSDGSDNCLTCANTAF
jgi:hypothetical protein